MEFNDDSTHSAHDQFNVSTWNKLAAILLNPWSDKGDELINRIKEYHGLANEQ